MNKRALIISAIVLAAPGLAASGMASASEADGDAWYITPFAGGITPDYHRDVDRTNFDAGLDVGKELGPIFNIELNGDAAVDQYTHYPRYAGHLNYDSLNLDLLAVASRTAVVSPYVGVGLGAIRTDYRYGYEGLDPGYSTHLAVNAEAGLLVKMWENADATSRLSLRPEVRMRWDNPGNSNLKDYLYNIGLQYSFGGSAHAQPVAMVAAPAPAPMPMQTPPPAAAPPAPPPVAQYVPKSTITLEGVNFEFNKADLTGASKPILDGAADGLKKNPQVRVEVQGHTDNIGSDEYNMQLSQKRAESVQGYLQQDGVSGDQLTAKGYGKTKPVADNKDAEGRAQNRRVVMYVVSNPSDVIVKGQGTTQETPTVAANQN